MCSWQKQLVFGIYPGGAAGGDGGLLTGPPDDPHRVGAALDALQGESTPFVVRCYDTFQDPRSPLSHHGTAPPHYEQYARGAARPLDLVLQFRSESGDVPGYLSFLRDRITRHHQHLYAVQITEEPNFTDGPNVIDGPYPQVRQALIQGVIAARQTLRALHCDQVKVGFNATPAFGPAAQFWSGLNSPPNPAFIASLDYAGLDFFPDVFRSLAPDGQPGDIRSSVIAILETMRNVWLPAAGIPASVPIHITEHGWPTGPARTPNRQAQVLETIIRTIYALRTRLNIERYMLFDLRDVSSSNNKASGPDTAAGLFRFFGITTADYTRKPAFDTFRTLIQEFGARRC